MDYQVSDQLRMSADKAEEAEARFDERYGAWLLSMCEWVDGE